MTEGPSNHKEIMELMDSCWHCKRSKEEHANGQCLFGSTRYQNYAEMVYFGINDVLTGKFVIRPFPGEPKKP